MTLCPTSTRDVSARRDATSSSSDRISSHRRTETDAETPLPQRHASPAQLYHILPRFRPPEIHRDHISHQTPPPFRLACLRPRRRGKGMIDGSLGWRNLLTGLVCYFSFMNYAPTPQGWH